VPVCRTSVDEGSAFGAAMLGGVAGGLFADVDEAVAACVRVRDQIDPEPDWLELYGERRERFRALYPALKSVLG
jgi:xylulokinase